MRYPFCAFANNNLGIQFNYSTFTGDFLASKGVGQFPVLPYVNIATGNLFLKATLVNREESVGKFEFGFVYNSQNTISWCNAVPEITAQVDKVKITLREKEGAVVDYIWSESQQSYISPAGAQSILHIQKINDEFILTNFKTGARVVFDVSGKIIAEYDARGFSIQYAYTDTELSSITTDAGTYKINKTSLKTEIGFIEKNSDTSELLGTWNFDSSNRLQSAVIPDPNNYTINYFYEGDTQHLTSASQTDGTAIYFDYLDKRVSALKQGSNGPSYQFNGTENTRTITDALQNTIAVTLDDQSRILSWEQNSETTTCDYDPISGHLKTFSQQNRAVIQRNFNDNGLVIEEIHPDGQTTQFDYDDFDPGTQAVIIKRELIYDNTDSAQKKFAVTRYVYDTTSLNGLLFRQLRFVIAPSGSVTEYRYDDHNQLASERTYLKKQYPVSILTSKNAIDFEMMKAWFSELSSSEKSAITLKMFSHNHRGQCLSVQAFTMIADNAEGVYTTDASNDNFEYTPQGNITAHDEKCDATRTAITAQAFDGLSRLITHQNALDENRAIVYADADQKRIVTEPNLRTETTCWNDAGQITSVATAIQGNLTTRIETKHYDAAGRLSAIKAVDGQTTYQLFDGLNRLRFTITPMGRVTEIRYDTVNRYQSMTHYYNTVPISLMTSPEALSVASVEAHLEENAQSDVTTYQIFDASSRLQFSMDGRGAITEYRYDLCNRKMATIAYADPLTASELSAIKQGTFTSSARTVDTSQDIVERIAYDLDGHIVATQDGDGYVTTHQRNPAGFEIYRRAYATKVAVDLSTDIVIPDSTVDDYAQCFYRDAKGQVCFTVDDVLDANIIVQQSYFPTGKVDTTTHYAAAAKSAPFTGSNPSTLIPAASSEDRITRCEYDLLKRLSKKKLPDMRVVSYEYDTMNHLVLESIGDDTDFDIPADVQSKTQITAKQFDDWGQLIAIASPLVYAKITSIQNDATLSEVVKAAKIKAVWDTQSERYQYDDTTGLHTAKFDIVPDDVTATDAANQAKTLFYYDADKRVALTVGPLGEAATTTHDPICNKPLEYYRFATAVDAAVLPTLTGGFITDTVKAFIKSSADDAFDAYGYDGCGDEIKHQDPDGFETDTHFNSFGEWDQKVLPINTKMPTLKITRQFNLRRQWIEEKKIAADQSITRKRSYQNLHGHVTSEADGNNATTAFTFEPRGVLKTRKNALSQITTMAHDAFGRKISETLPGNQCVVTDYRQTKRSVKKVLFDSQHNQLAETSVLLDAQGNAVQKTDACGNSTTRIFNQANQTSVVTDALGNQTINTYDLRGLLSATEIINAKGISQTSTTLDYTLSRQLQTKTKDAKSLALKTRHKINALSQRSETVKPSNRKQKFVHNKRGLATEHHLVLDDINDLTVGTLQDYNAQKQASSVTAKTTNALGQYQKNTGFDAFGRSAVETVDPNVLALTRKKIVDSENRVLATVDAKKQIHYSVYDAMGNRLFEINPNGGVTEHRYDENNKPIFTTQYHIPIDITALKKFNDQLSSDAFNFVMTESDIRGLLQASGLDRKTAYFYDAAHNERFRVSGAGAVTELRYNKNGEKIASIQYVNFISLVDLNFETLTTEALIQKKAVGLRNTKKDKSTFRILDALGQERFIIHSDGSVVEKRYNGFPNAVTTEIQYASVLAVDTLESSASKTVDDAITQFKALSSAQDRTTRWLHDGLGRIQYHVKANGAVTKFDYDGDTQNPLTITKFSQCIIATLQVSDDASLRTALEAHVVDPLKDNIEKREYDGAGREIKRTNALGQSESWTYDGASRKATHTTTTGQTWRYEYDGASRLSYEYSPETTVYSSNVVSNKIVVNAATQSVKKTVHYDENANTLAIISADGLEDQHTVTFAYTALDQKIQDCWPSLAIDDPSKNTDFLTRPEQTVSVSKNVIVSAHGQKLVAIDEDNNPEFYCHDAAGQLIYRVNALGYVIEYSYDARGQAIAFTAYANPLTLDLKNYLSVGLTADLVFQHQIDNQLKDPKKDNTIFQEYDSCGRICKVTKQEVVCYIPNADTTKPASIHTFSPVTKHTYNAFGEVIKESKLIDCVDSVDVTRDEFKWFDANGHEIAIVNANGAAKIFTLDAEGRKVEEYAYANNITSDNLATLHEKSFSELQGILTPLSDASKDHHTLTPRDVMGRVTGVYHVGIVVQQKVAGQLAFEDLPAQTLGVTYTYTADHQIKSIAYPNNEKEIYYYDERGHLAAKALPARTQKASDGSDGARIRPIIYYHVNAHGKRVEVLQPVSGCAVDLEPSSTVVPQPLSKSDQDRYARFVYDAKNHIVLHQDESDALKQITYNKTGQVSRKYHLTTVADPKAANQEKTHLDETRCQYDALKRLIKTGVYRDTVLQGTQAYLHDAFSVIGEGPGDGTYPIQHFYDLAARKWKTMNENGGVQLIGHNAAGEETVKITSQVQDLSQKTYDDLAVLMAERDALVSSASKIHFVETLRDAIGRTAAFVEARYLDDNGVIVAPKHQIMFSNFNEKTSVTTPNNETTDFAHNKIKKMVRQIDPAISVTDEQGNTTVVRPVTTMGYGDLMRKIGERDANGHTQLWERDEANQVIKHTLADGTATIHKRDIFSNEIEFTSAAGNTWKKVVNGKNKVVQVTMPSGDVWHYVTNENNFVYKVMPPVGSVTGTMLYAQGPYGDMSAEYLPMGEAHLYTHDRHHNVLLHTAVNANGTTAYTHSTTRDYWSRVTDIVDGAGSTFKNSYFLDGLLKQELQLTMSNPGQTLAFDSTQNSFSTAPVATPLKNIAYEYLTPLRLSKIIDGNSVNPQTLVQIFNINRDPIRVTETKASGGVLRDSMMTYNAMRLSLTHTDNNFSASHLYDPALNRRNIKAICNGILHDGWWTYDAADRVLVDDGQMINGVIQPVFVPGSTWGYLAPNQGNRYSYQSRLRATQSLYFSDASGEIAADNPLSAILSYNKNEVISVIATSPHINTQPQGNASIASGEVVRMDIDSDDIIPIAPFLRLKAGPLFSFIQLFSHLLKGQAAENTASFAVGCNIIIPGTGGVIQAGRDNPLFIYTIKYLLHPRGTYAYLANTKMNGKTYQGALTVPAKDAILFYTAQIAYKPDGNISAVVIPITAQNQYFPFITGTNANGYLIKSAFQPMQSFPAKGYMSIRSTYSSFNVDGVPANVVSICSSTTITENNVFKIFDRTVIAKTTAQITNVDGTNVITTMRLYDSRYRLNAVVNAKNTYDAQDQTPHIVYFDRSAANGNMLVEWMDNTTKPSMRFIPDCRGNIVSSYGTVINAAGETKLALQLTASPVTPFTILQMMNLPGTVVQPGDNWQTISHRIFGADYAGFLHATGVQLMPGQVINMRQILAAYNKDSDFTPYEKLMAVIYNGINPALKTPQPPPPKPHHHSFWHEFIEGVVAVVILVVATPVIGSAIFGVVAGATMSAVELGVSTALAGVLASAAQQGVAVVFGDQQGFSVADMLDYAATAGITAGLASKLGINHLLSKGGFTKYAEAFAAEASVNAIVQVFEMGVGLRRQFDLKLLIEQSAAALLSGALSKGAARINGAAGHAVDVLANAATGKAFGYQQNAANLAANFVGDEAADAENDVLSKQQIKAQTSNAVDPQEGAAANLHVVSNPRDFTDHALQTASHFIADSLQGDDALSENPIAPFYTAYRDTLSSGLDALNGASAFSLNAQNQTRATQVHAQRVQNAGRNAASFFNSMTHDFDSASKFEYGFTKAASKTLGSLAYSTMDDLDHPVRTLFALYAAGQSTETAILHFAQELMNPQTRPEALMQAENGAKLAGFALTTKLESLSNLGAEELGGALGGPAVDVASYFVPGGGEVKAAEGVVDAVRVLKGADADAFSPTRLKVMENIADSRAARSNTGFGIFSKRAMAREFYARGGWESRRIDGHLDGIDFNCEVAEDVVTEGKVLEQHQMPNAPMGNYFTRLNASRSHLGIYTSGRSSSKYVALTDISVLRSTTSNIVDKWSMATYSWDIELEGGETQYFTHNLTDWRKI
ncbi:MAG: polymorphic toxin type 46 domain-containing protein [Coxiellaceae bacterium]|nr:polymorphic toxin type 46 domain-containing protein [Coxiellaceae bacterium]